MGDLGHARRVYDWWSRRHGLFRAFVDAALMGRADELRDRSVERLAPAPGDAVLDLACGWGESFGRLRDRVGPEGRVVGVDYSPGMARAARDGVREAGWENVGVVRADAAHLPVRPASVDGAYTSLSLSAIPDHRAAIGAVHTALRPGGRFVVLDARPFQAWPWRLLNPVVNPVSAFATNWFPDRDLVADLRAAFDSVEATSFNRGSVFIAVARKAE